MIKLKELTPAIYYKESRDFQFIGRLFDLVLNSIKTEADLLYNLPLNTDSNDKLVDLLAFTLGFKPKHQYNSRQLKAVCSVFPEILRNKGSIKALKIACEALFSSMDIAQNLTYDFTTGKDNTELNLYIAQDFGDITILTDLLSYVLPAGMSCNIIREFHLIKESNTNIGIKNTVTVNKINTDTLSELAILDDTDKTKPLNRAKISITEPGFSVNSEIKQLD